MNRKILALISTILILSACSAVSPHLEMEPPPLASSSDNRRVEKSANIKVEVKDIKQAERSLHSEINKLGGYVRSSNKHDDESSYLLISVPPKNLLPTLDYIASLGKELTRNVSSTDVTMQYIDLKAKLENLKALRDRLKGLLHKSDDIEKLLKVEQELARIQTEIDSLTAQINHLNQTSSETTIATSLQKKHRPGPIALVGKTIAYLGKKLFIWD